MKRLLRWTGQLVLALVLLVLLLQFWYFAHIVWWTRFDPVSTSFMRAQHDTLRERDPDVALKHRWIDYDQISPHLKRAVIAAEDAKFCEHNGFDFQAIEKAYEANAQGKKLRGASTISQQTAKNVFLWPGRDWVRKGFEAGYTVLIETLWGKRRIMEVYLNVAEWAPGVYGAEAASRHWFDKSADKLTAREAARLAAILPSPLKWKAAQPGPYVKRRSGKIGKAAGTINREGMAACVLG